MRHFRFLLNIFLRSKFFHGENISHFNQIMKGWCMTCIIAVFVQSFIPFTFTWNYMLVINFSCG